MHRFLFSLIASSLIISFDSTAHAGNLKPDEVQISSTDWPWWRGPNRNGIAAANQKLPLEWSQTKNVMWKTPILGRGHGSATVVGNRIFLATADHGLEIQAVICLDRKSGKQLWKTNVHSGGLDKKGNKKATRASSSVACDGKRIFINFLNSNAV